MENPHSRKKDWAVTREAFDLLLTRLDSDREQAARKYEQIRKSLLAISSSTAVCHLPSKQMTP